MYLPFNYSAVCLLFVLISGIYGYDISCDVNNTLFVPDGLTATFRAENFTKFHFPLLRLTFSKTGLNSRLLFYIRYIFDPERPDVRFYDSNIQNRTNVSLDVVHQNTMTIHMSNVSSIDNGTYVLDERRRYCWILFNMNLQQSPVGQVTEGGAIRIYGNPAVSLMVSPIVNATVMWLVDGVNVNQTVEMLPINDVLWIPSIGRKFNGKIVTYRAVQDSGKTNEVNMTLEVIYGPESPITLSLERSHHLLKSGDFMPDITCQVDCTPSCIITWGPHSPDHTLRLGQVTSKSSGEYTCYASNSGKTVYRSIYVNIVGFQRQTRDNGNTASKKRRTGKQLQKNRQMTALDHYEDLDANTRSISIMELYSQAQPEHTLKKAYENTETFEYKVRH